MASLPPQLSQRIAAFQTKLDERLEDRKKGLRTNPSIITLLFDKIFARTETAAKKNCTLTWFGQYTLEDKELAIGKIKTDLNGKQVDYSEKDIDAARDSDTGKILAEYEDVLPAGFKNKERIMDNARDARITEREFRTRK